MLRLVGSLCLVAVALISVSATSAFGQANIPSTKQPEISSMSPALKKAVDDVQKQCPTCATIDLGSGQKTWIIGAGQNRSQIDLSDGCHLPAWAHDQSDALRKSLDKAFSGDELETFHSLVPADCEQKAFVYYLGVARQVLGKAKPQ
jgi:hypothetical protein